MAQGPQRNDSLEILMIIGALAGLCLLIAGAVADLTIRTSAEIGGVDDSDIHSQ